MDNNGFNNYNGNQQPQNPWGQQPQQNPWNQPQDPWGQQNAWNEQPQRNPWEQQNTWNQQPQRNPWEHQDPWNRPPQDPREQPQWWDGGNQPPADDQRKQKPRSAKSSKPLKIILIASAAVLVLAAVFFALAKLGVFSEKFEAYYADFEEADVLTEDGMQYVDSRLLVTAEEGVSFSKIQQLAEQEGGEIVGYISLTNDYQIEFSDGKDYDALQALIDEWSADSSITMVTMEYVLSQEENSVNYETDEWTATVGKIRTGNDWNAAYPDGTNWWAEAIGMPQVWNLNTKFKTVRVGLIDGYFDIDHEDLVFAEDGVTGQADYYSADEDEDAGGELSHGTVNAGIIAAKNNDVGICGVSQNAELYGASNSGYGHEWSSSIIEWKYDIAWLLNKGVKIINMSVGLSLNYAAQQEATGADTRTTGAVDTLNGNKNTFTEFLKRCLEHYDFLIVKAPGNNSNEVYERNDDLSNNYGYTYVGVLDETVEWVDARYDFLGAIDDEEVRSHIIVVGSVDLVQTADSYDYEISFFSDIGERIDIFAPGGQIKADGTYTHIKVLSTYIENRYGYMKGTSQAAPMVAGAAALVWGCNPDLTAVQVKEILCRSYSYSLDAAMPITDDTQQEYAVRPVLNAYLAVQRALVTDADQGENLDDTAMLLGAVYALMRDDNGNLRPGYGEDDTPVEIYNESGDTLITTVIPQGGNGFCVTLEPGTYQVRTAPDGYSEAQETVTLAAGQTTFCWLRVNVSKYSGKVLDAMTGAPIAGAGVSFISESGDTAVTTQTDAYGNYSVNEEGNLTVGTYDIVVTANGYHNTRVNSVVIPEDGSVKVDDILLAPDNLVTDAYTNTCTVDDGIIEIHIPQINLDSDDVKQINQEIYDFYYQRAGWIEDETEEYGIGGGDLHYTWAVNGDILSLVTVYDFGSIDVTWPEYMVSNVDMDGNAVTGDEILEAAGYTEEQYLDALSQTLQSADEYALGSWNYFVSESGVGAGELGHWDLDQTLAEDNLRASTPYLNEDGRLCAMVHIYMSWGVTTEYDEIFCLPETAAQQSGADEGEAAADTLFSVIGGKEYLFSSGAGGWSESLTVNEDGTFSGNTADQDLGDMKEWVCEFTGRFGNVTQIGEYEYTVEVTELSAPEFDDYTIEDGLTCSYTEPYGISQGAVFHVYLPGMDVSAMPSDYLNMACVSHVVGGASELPCCGLYFQEKAGSYIEWDFGDSDT